MAILFNMEVTGHFRDLLRVDVALDRGAVRTALEEVAEDFRFEMRKAYKRSGTPGYKWPENNLKYRRYDKRKGNNPPGVRTGAVRRNFTAGQGRGAVEEYSGNQLRVGTSLNYANFSAAGPRRPRRGVTVDQFSQVFRRGEVRGRRIPVRDPLLQIYTHRTRKIRKPIQRRWESYVVEQLKGIIENPISVTFTRPNRRSRRIQRRRA